MTQENKLRRLRFQHAQLQTKLIEEQTEAQKKIDAQLEKSRKEMEAAVRRQKAKERMEASFKRRQDQEQQFKQVHEEFVTRVRPYLKPKFVALEEKFKKQEEEEANQKKKLLEQIKQITKPIDFEQIRDHSEK